jgi:hypothetical protein
MPISIPNYPVSKTGQAPNDKSPSNQIAGDLATPLTTSNAAKMNNYEAVKKYWNISKIPAIEWYNEVIIKQKEAIGFDYVKDTFIKKYDLDELSHEKQERMIQTMSSCLPTSFS